MANQTNTSEKEQIVDLPERREEKKPVKETDKVKPIAEQYQVIGDNKVYLVDREGKDIPSAVATFEPVTRDGWIREVEVDETREGEKVAKDAVGQGIEKPESRKMVKEEDDEQAVEGAITQLIFAYWNATQSHVLRAKEINNTALGHRVTLEGKDNYLIARSG